MSRYSALSTAATRDVLRNRVGLFFTFIFPLLFLGIFGLLFGRQASGEYHVIDFLAPGARLMCWGIGNGLAPCSVSRTPW